jgi:hypothetical protein
MLAELLLYVITPVPRSLRRLGLLKDSVGLWSRAARCRKAWEIHEKNCHAVIMESLFTLKNRRKVVILGSGLLRDVPIRALIQIFDQVICVDAVHLASIRMRYAFEPKVRFVTCDLTGVADWVLGKTEGRKAPLSAFQQDQEVDFIISANVLSQLPMSIETFLENRPYVKTFRQGPFLKKIIEWHLADLEGFSSAQICLLTDISYRNENPEEAPGQKSEIFDLMQCHILPSPDQNWDWEVAPQGEADPDMRILHRVYAYKNWKSEKMTPCSS